MCNVRTFDYNKEKQIVPDVTDPNPVKSPPPPMKVMDIKQKVHLMVWDAAPQGFAAALAPAPKRDAEWVKKMMEIVVVKPVDFENNINDLNDPQIWIDDFEVCD